MTDINHRRSNRKPVNERYRAHEYHNGTAPTGGKADPSRAIGKTDYLDKSMSSWSADAPLSGERIGAGIVYLCIAMLWAIAMLRRSGYFSPTGRGEAIILFGVAAGCLFWAGQGLYYGQIPDRYLNYYSRRDQPQSFRWMIGLWLTLAAAAALAGLASLFDLFE